MIAWRAEVDADAPTVAVVEVAAAADAATTMDTAAAVVDDAADIVIALTLTTNAHETNG